MNQHSLPSVEDALRDALHNDEKTCCLVDYFMSDAPEYASPEFLDRSRLLADARVLAVALREFEEQLEATQRSLADEKGLLEVERGWRYEIEGRLSKEITDLKEQLEAAQDGWKAAADLSADVSRFGLENERLLEQLEAGQEQLRALRDLATVVRDAWTISDATLNPLDDACRKLDDWLTPKQEVPDRILGINLTSMSASDQPASERQ